MRRSHSETWIVLSDVHPAEPTTALGRDRVGYNIQEQWPLWNGKPCKQIVGSATCCCAEGARSSIPHWCALILISHVMSWRYMILCRLPVHFMFHFLNWLKSTDLTSPLFDTRPHVPHGVERFFFPHSVTVHPHEESGLGRHSFSCFAPLIWPSSCSLLVHSGLVLHGILRSY